MQIGIDLGATKIESVVLDENGSESFRERIECPKIYIQTIEAIKKIVLGLEKKLNKKLDVGVCHPGIHSTHTGLVKNAPNCYWIEKKPLQKDLRESLKREVFCENDANCFTLSEAIDGSCEHYKIVFGVILGSGCGGGLVVDKKIVTGTNGLGGEWGHNQLPYLAAKKENLETNILRESEIESFVSGHGLSKKFFKKYGKKLKAHEIFKAFRNHDIEAEKIIEEFKINLAMSLSTIINILDPDAFVFGGGLSNEINFFDEVENLVKKYVVGREYEGIFLKPKYGDASGVRGAARLGRKANY